ncbi:MAG: glycosyltransferase family 4 protein [Deltaproteobacteria bacterium]|nr:MAG: glycosyltransferase family 4 protein [Deltaproteobacteria bacterium]TMQ03629.1 MAG: glycosyltransferase family 4 protein [Deltaproteobacteria bacterium]
MAQRPHHLQPRAETVRVALVYRDVTGLGVSHIGLGVSAAYTAKTLRHHGIWAEVWPTQSAAKLRDRLRHAHTSADQRGDLRPTHVILAAPWIPTQDLAATAAEFPEVRFVVVSHSNVGFLAADPHAIRLLRETADLQLATHNVFVGGNSRKFTDWATEAWGVTAVCLPNLYCLTETFPEHDRRWQGGALRLGLFGANRPLKNFLSSAAAAVELARRLRVPVELLLSTGRNEGGNQRALDEMTEHIANLRVTRTGWLSWPGFRRLLRTVDLVFQVSYTETFNVVTADAIAEGVPVVASDAIDWVPRWWQARADEPLDVARVAERLLRDPDAPRHGRAALKAYVDGGLVDWRRFLCPDVAQITGMPARIARDDA